MPPVILMLHCTMHRPFIRRPKWLAKAHPYVMSFFFGIPTGYAEHHMGMHHVEDNMGEDLSSTMRYRRDSFLHFLAYWARFFFFILPELTVYLAKKRRTTMAKRALIGDLSHQALIVGALLLNWRFGLVAFAFPYFIVRFMMMAGNWGQHAFINTALKNDGFANSITCINSGYNARCFNDGYHIGHHLKANRHWTEMPQDFLDNRATYARKRRDRLRGARLLPGLGPPLDRAVARPGEALRPARRARAKRRRGDRAAQVARAAGAGRRVGSDAARKGVSPEG